MKQTPTENLKLAIMANTKLRERGGSVGQMLYSLFRFGMLANMKTPARILFSNAATSLMEVPVRQIAPLLARRRARSEAESDEHALSHSGGHQARSARLVQERD